MSKDDYFPNISFVQRAFLYSQFLLTHPVYHIVHFIMYYIARDSRSHCPQLTGEKPMPLKGSPTRCAGQCDAFGPVMLISICVMAKVTRSAPGPGESRWNNGYDRLAQPAHWITTDICPLSLSLARREEGSCLQIQVRSSLCACLEGGGGGVGEVADNLRQPLINHGPVGYITFQKSVQILAPQIANFCTWFI